MTKGLEYPFAVAKVGELNVGDRVKIAGRVFAGRDRLHKFLAEGGRPPVDLRDGALYHCGPIVVREAGAWKVIAAGPTTSLREEPYMADLIERFHIRVIIGKGGMGDATLAACARHGCVYIHAAGGAGVLLGQCIERVDGVYFLKEFGAAEALWDFHVAGMEGIVSMDAHGRSLHRRVRESSRRALANLR